MTAIAMAMAVMVNFLLDGPGPIIFPFNDDPRTGALMMRLLAALLFLVNCMVVLHIVEWGAEFFTARGWSLDGNYAVLFILWTEAVAIGSLLSLGRTFLRGHEPRHPLELIAKSALPLSTLLLAAVLAPWTATFTAFLLGLEFRRDEVGEPAASPPHPA